MKRVKDHRYLYRRGDVLWFRRAVPAHARAAFGGIGEVQISLRTSDISQARHILHRELAKFEQRLSLSSGSAIPVEVIALSRLHVPSKQEVEEAVRQWIAARLLRTTLGDYSTEHGRAEGRMRLKELEVYSDAVQEGLAFGAAVPLLTTTWLAEAFAEDNGWLIERGSELERQLLLATGRGQLEASRWQLQDLHGKPREIRDATFEPDQYRRDEERKLERHRGELKVVPLQTLFDGYVAESCPAASTIKAWKRQITKFAIFLGHDNANAITLSDVVAWKEKLRSQPNTTGGYLSARTVRDTYIAAVKTVLRWGHGNGKIAFNPAASVRVTGPRATVERERGLTNIEAEIILSATLLPPEARLSLERARAQRWVPWLCAYTGARVNEITQLRTNDVKQIDGIWTIRISPEAGSVKNGKARTVPLHSHLLDQGFPAIVASAAPGPIFFDPKKHRGGSDGNPQYKKVGEHLARWVRASGVTDPRVQPNHGWRHRFKTQARNVDMNVELRDAIQGHAPRSEGEGYGDTSPASALREIEKLLRYDVRGV